MEKEKTFNKIAIKFSDNDFHHTVTWFLKLLNKSFEFEKYKDDPVHLKKVIAELFNRSAAGLYWLVQNKLSHRDDWDAASYMKITEDNVFVNSEVDECLKENDGHLNGEFFILKINKNEDFVFCY